MSARSTWVNGAVSGTVVRRQNSLVGTTAGDDVGSGGVTALTNGNYVVSSPNWDSSAAANVGAATWANGETLTHAPVSSLNSIVGTSTNDNVGSGGVTALTNARYVVSSPDWDSSAALDVGAVTWAIGGATTQATVSTGNSLVGNTDGDNVGSGGVTALSNGNYVVSSPFFERGRHDGGRRCHLGRRRPRRGRTAEHAASSLVGGQRLDHVGSGGITALTNGNYVVSSPDWDSAIAADVGAVTWAVGNSSTAGLVTRRTALSARRRRIRVV